MVGAPAGLQDHLGGLLFAEEGLYLAAPELAPQHRALLFIHTMQREDMLGRINRDALILHLGGPWLLFDTSTLARDAVGPSTPTTALEVYP